MRQINKISELTPILPCPFCGGKAEYSYYGEYRYIICGSCGARGPKKDVKEYSRRPFGNLDVIELAIIDWNKRKSETLYRIKHIPTGLFYAPVTGRFTKYKTNLKKTGKVYHKKPTLKHISHGYWFKGKFTQGIISSEWEVEET